MDASKGFSTSYFLVELGAEALSNLHSKTATSYNRAPVSGAHLPEDHAIAIQSSIV